MHGDSIATQKSRGVRDAGAFRAVIESPCVQRPKHSDPIDGPNQPAPGLLAVRLGQAGGRQWLDARQRGCGDPPPRSAAANVPTVSSCAGIAAVAAVVVGVVVGAAPPPTAAVDLSFQPRDLPVQGSSRRPTALGGRREPRCDVVA